MAEIKFKTEWLTQISLLANCGTPKDVTDLCYAIMQVTQGGDTGADKMSPLTATLFLPIAESINEERTKSERNRTNRQGKRNENERSLKEKERETEEEREEESGETKEEIPHTPLEENKEGKGEELEEDKEKEREYIRACACESDVIVDDLLPAPTFVPETDPKRMTDKMLEEEFDALWKLYPRKAGRSDALRHYKAARKQGVAYDTIEDGIIRYADSVRNEDPKFIAMGSTWFCGHRWEDQYVRKKTALEKLWEL